MATRYRSPYIARPGKMLILLSLVLAIWLNWLEGEQAAVPFLLLAALFAFLFRDPYRRIPSLPLGLLSPVDGQVASIGPGRDPFLDRPALVIRIRMHSLGVFTVRSPVEGAIARRWYPGRANERRRRENGDSRKYHFAECIATDEGDQVVIAVERAITSRVFNCSQQSGERVGQGERCGFLPLGSAVAVYAPEQTRAEVQAGDKVLSGSQLLATLVHRVL